jgi:hypothetical protein
MKLFTTEMTRIFILDFTVALLMSPFVTFHIFHLFAAKTADLQLRHVSSLHMMRQVDLQLVTATAMLANKSRLVFTVFANAVPLQSVSALVFHVADLALEEVVWPMYPLMLFQGSRRVTSSLTLVTLERFSVHVSDVSLDFLRIVELFLTKWTRIPYLF